MATSFSDSTEGLDDVVVGVTFGSSVLPICRASSCKKLGAVLHSLVLRFR